MYGRTPKRAFPFFMGWIMTFKFIIGVMSVELAKNDIMGGFHFKYYISFYGCRWFRFKRKVRRTIKRRRQMINSSRFDKRWPYPEGPKPEWPDEAIKTSCEEETGG